MIQHIQTWAVVLATDVGDAEPALLSQGLQRALAVAPCARVLSVVTQEPHDPLPDGVIAQPADRGTAHSLLLALAHVVAHEPDAIVAVFPTDHFVRDEATLAEGMRDALGLAKSRPDAVYLLGMEPDQPRSDCGFIVPKHRGGSGAARVARFVEAPSLQEARTLQGEGGLWNLGVLAASVSVLLELYARNFAATLAAMCSDVAAAEGDAAWDRFRRLPTRDLTRDVLTGQEEKLRVLPVAHCGWGDTAAELRAPLTQRQTRAGSYGESPRRDTAESAPPAH
jgi:mannose-1-phosphate guanylyltransferase